MIKSLKLKNFKKHKDLSVDFTDGLNIITGDNYTGKSSILHGILFCLFGPSAVPGGNAIIVNNGATTVKGELTFEAHGSEYKIERTKTKVALYEDGKKVATSASAVGAAVEEVLGMTKKQYLQLQYAAQKQTEALLTVGATTLNKSVEDVAGVTIVDEVLDKCKTELATATAKLEMLEPYDIDKLTADKDDLTTRLSKQDKVIEAGEERLKIKSKAMQAAKEALAEYYRQVDDNLHKAARRRKLDSRLHNLHEELDKYNQKLEELPELDEHMTEENYQKMLAQYEQEKELFDKFETLSYQVASLDRVIQEEEEEFTRIDNDLRVTPEPESDPDEMVERMQELKEKFTLIQHDTSQKKNLIKQGVCSACGRPFDEHVNIDEVKAELEALQSEYGSLVGEYQRLGDAHKTALSQRAERERMESQFRILEEGIKEKRPKLQELVKELHALPPTVTTASMDAMTTELDRVRKGLAAHAAAEADRNNAIDQTVSLQSRIAETMEEIEEIGELVQLPEELEMMGKVDIAKNEWENASNTLSDEKKKEMSMRAELNSVTETLAKAEKQGKQREQFEQRAQTIKNLQKFLRGNRERFLSQIWSGLLAYASNFADNCTSGDINQVSRDTDGNFSYTENDHEFVAEAASGAQKSIMGLGVQMGLTQLLPCSLRAVMLDEPTADMSDEKALSLSTMLSNADEQTIMVTHRLLDSSVAHNVIELEN